MKKYVILGIFAVVCFFGGYKKHIVDPYEVTYNKVVVNVPVPYTADLDGNGMIVGEKYLAKDLVNELIKNGFEARVFSWEDTYSNLNFRQGVDIVMRGWPELRLPKYHNYVDKDKILVLYETVPYKKWEYRNADLIFTGSLKNDVKYKEMGFNSYYIPQFTRLDKFYPDYKDEYKNKLLFIGNKWPNFVTRKTVYYGLKNGFDLSIYGSGWDEVLSDEQMKFVKKKQVENDELRYYYSAADIVFNDTREDMIKAGYISNRIFDATASGAFVISDYVKEIEDIYGDSIPMYKNEDEFVELVNFYLANPEIRKEKAKKAREITVKNFGADKVVAKMALILRKYINEHEDKYGKK